MILRRPHSLVPCRSRFSALVPLLHSTTTTTTSINASYNILNYRASSRRWNSSSTITSTAIAKMKEWPFAPLNPELAKDSGKPTLAGIVFDVDGTLCLPQSYMFSQMRSLLSIGPKTDILTHLNSLPEPQKSEASNGIKKIERDAMAKQTPQPGLTELMQYLDTQQLKKGICTRNFDEPINHLLRNFLDWTTFSPIVTRQFVPWKPAPEGILHCASAFGETTEQRASRCVMVGDSRDDVLAGRRAGAVTVLLAREGNEGERTAEETDFVISRLDELIDMLDKGKIP